MSGIGIGKPGFSISKPGLEPKPGFWKKSGLESKPLYFERPKWWGTGKLMMFEIRGYMTIKPLIFFKYKLLTLFSEVASIDQWIEHRFDHLNVCGFESQLCQQFFTWFFLISLIKTQISNTISLPVPHHFGLSK